MNPVLRAIAWPFAPAAFAILFMVSLVVIDIWRAVTVDDEPAPDEGVGAIAEILPQALGPDETVHFTVFHTVEEGALRIITGLNYERPGTPPYRQYCYAEFILDKMLGSWTIVNLASRKGDEPIKYFTISTEQAQALSAKVGDLATFAQTKCRFIDAGPAAMEKRLPSPMTSPRGLSQSF